jgi:hypothetical protein
MKQKMMLAALCAGVGLTASAFAGWEFTSVTKTVGQQAREGGTNTVNALVDGDRARIEFGDGAGNSMLKKGAYLLTRDGGKTSFLVNPTDKTYCKWDMEAMAGLAGGAMKIMNMKFSSPTVEKLLEEKGEKLLGLPTRHYRFRTSYTMEMGFMGFKQSRQIVTDQDMWATDELTDLAAGFWVKDRTFQTGNKELDELIKAQRADVRGFPLKTVNVTKQTSQRGTEESTTLMEITSLKKARVPDSAFELPSDYAETSMLPTMTPKDGATGEPQGQTEGQTPRQPLTDLFRKFRNR